MGQEQRGGSGEDRRLEYLARVDQRARQAADGNGVQAEDAMPDREHGDHEHLAVRLADVLREHGGGFGRDADLRALGELDAGLADQADPEAWDRVRTGWIRGR